MNLHTIPIQINEENNEGVKQFVYLRDFPPLGAKTALNLPSLVAPKYVTTAL